MARKLLYLNGLAILTVVVAHASAYGLQAMFLWTDRYRSVAAPNFDQLDSLAFYVTIAVRQLVVFAVPAFYFVSGYFIAFTAKGAGAGGVTWKTVMPRVRILLVPFVIWTILRYVLLRRWPSSLDEVLLPYHFIPVLIQFYLLSPLIAPLARRYWRLLLVIAASIQLAIVGLRYWEVLFAVTLPTGDRLSSMLPGWFFLESPFYFPLGVVAGFHIGCFKDQLFKLKWALLSATIVLATLAIAEYHVVDNFTGQEWIGPHAPGLARPLFVLTFLLTFLAFHKSSFPLSSSISQLGSRSLGIYLANIPAIYVVAVMMYFLTPWALGNQLLYQSLLFIVGLGGPLVLMEIVRRTPARPLYRYLFG